MTALAERRRVHTLRAAVAAGGAIVVATVLTAIGVTTLATSTIGAEVETDALPTLRLPFTATAFLGLVDDEGALRAAAMLALAPDGIGGSVVSVEVTADIASNRSMEVIPLSNGLSTGGVDLLRLDAEGITGTSFDLVTVLKPDEFAALVDPIGEAEADFAVGVRDESTGRTWPSGRNSLQAADIADVLVASAEGVTSASLSSTRTAVWDGLSVAIGGGMQSLDGVFEPGELDPQGVPANIASFWRRLIAGEVNHRALSVEPLAVDRVPAGEEVTFHDWSETLMVVAQIAPARVAAPLDAATLRLVVPFTDDDLNGLGLTIADVAVTALDRFGMAGLNVVSVLTSPPQTLAVPKVTEVWVGEQARVADGAESFALLLGDVTASVGDHRVEAVDVIVTLGDSFLDDIGRDIRPALAESVFDPDR